MYYPKEEALTKLMELIEATKELLPQVQVINSELMDLRTDTVVGDLIPFHRAKLELGVLDSALNDMQHLINVESIVKTLQNDKDVDYKIGDTVEALMSIRTKSRKLHGKDIDVTGFGDFSAGADFQILDIDGANFTLYPYKTASEYLVYATRDQMNSFFKKSDEEVKTNWVKVEFALNAPHLNYTKDLEQIRLYETPAKERTKHTWDYAFNYSHQTQLFNVIADEAFGIMGSAYFKGIVKPNYNDIMFKFGEKFMVGFTQSKNEEELYKYNGKISFFTKESGKNGQHYFPKDVLIDSQKGRVTSIMEIKQQINYIPQEEQTSAQG